MNQICSCEDSIFDGRGHCTRCGLEWPGYQEEVEAFGAHDGTTPEVEAFGAHDGTTPELYSPSDDEALACRLCNSVLYVVSPGPNSLEVIAELIRGATGYSETVRDRALVLAAAVLESVGEQ